MHEHGVHLVRFIIDNMLEYPDGDDLWYETDALDKARRTLPKFIQEKPGGTFD